LVDDGLGIWAIGSQINNHWLLGCIDRDIRGYDSFVDWGDCFGLGVDQELLLDHSFASLGNYCVFMIKQSDFELNSLNLRVADGSTVGVVGEVLAEERGSGYSVLNFSEVVGEDDLVSELVLVFLVEERSDVGLDGSM